MKAIINGLNEATKNLSVVLCHYFPEDSPLLRLDKRVKEKLDSTQGGLLHILEALRDFQKANPTICEQVNRSLKL